MDRTKAQLFPCTMRGAFCDIFNCRTQAKWFIGRPDGPLVPDRALKLCDEHLGQVVGSIPQEMLPGQPQGPKCDECGQEFTDGVYICAECEKKLEEAEVENVECQNKQSKTMAAKSLKPGGGKGGKK